MKKRTDFYIYILFRPNGIPCYVGKGTGNRWNLHKHRAPNNHLARIIKLAGGELSKVKFKENISEKEAFKTERWLIKTIGREINGGPLVNQTDGGEGQSGRVVSSKTRKRMSRALKGKYVGSNNANFGRKASKETRAKQRAKKLGGKHTKEHRAAISKGNKNKKRSLKTCRAISKGKTGKKATEATKAILRTANRSRDPKVRARISRATKKAMARKDVKARLRKAMNKVYRNKRKKKNGSTP